MTDTALPVESVNYADGPDQDHEVTNTGIYGVNCHKRFSGFIPVLISLTDNQ